MVSLDGPKHERAVLFKRNRLWLSMRHLMMSVKRLDMLSIPSPAQSMLKRLLPRIDDPHSHKRAKRVERERRRQAEPTIFPQNHTEYSGSYPRFRPQPSPRPSPPPNRLSLYQLPDETWCMISAYPFIDDTDNVLIASVKVVSASRNRCPKPLELKQRWSEISCGDIFSGMENSSQSP